MLKKNGSSSFGSYPAQGASESFDCDSTATYTSGTIIINVTQVDSIPRSSMGGGMGGGGRRGGFGRMYTDLIHKGSLLIPCE